MDSVSYRSCQHCTVIVAICIFLSPRLHVSFCGSLINYSQLLALTPRTLNPSSQSTHITDSQQFPQMKDLGKLFLNTLCRLLFSRIWIKWIKELRLTFLVTVQWSIHPINNFSRMEQVSIVCHWSFCILSQQNKLLISPLLIITSDFLSPSPESLLPLFFIICISSEDYLSIQTWQLITQLQDKL